MEYTDIKILAQGLEKNISRVIVGKSREIELVLAALFAGGHVLLEDVPGTGKTTMAKSLAKSLSCAFSRVQFTPDLLPADITGLRIYAQQTGTFTFVKGPVFTNVLLADEINRATPKTQSAMLEVMQEHKVTVGNDTYKLSEPFFVLATQNPIEQDGTYPLPEAQMDRFIFKLLVSYPANEELLDIVKMTQITMAETAESVISGAEILQMRALAAQVPVCDEVMLYAINLVSNTHPEVANTVPAAKKYIKYGASPRAAQGLITAAKVRALMCGRYNVSYEDIDTLAYPVLRHRIKINYTAVNDKLSVDDVVGMIIKETKKV